MASRTTLSRDALDATPAAGDAGVVRPSVDHGRLATYAALGGLAGAVPLPWVPDSLVRRVRGALAHDVAARHGVSLTPEARAALAEPSGGGGPPSATAQALRFVGVRLGARLLSRFGPFALVWPAREAVRTFVLGHLLDRYVAVARAERAVRIDLAEARRVRRAIDGAVVRALAVAPSRAVEPTAVDDQLDAFTALIDGLIGLAAGVPARVTQRLDAAFDELVSEADG